MSRSHGTGLEHRIGQLIMVVVLAVTTLGFSAGSASACSCATGDITDRIDASPAAFVGTLVDKRGGGLADSNSEATYVFEVESWIKGDLGRVIEVRAPSQGTACGLGSPSGDARTGLLLFEDPEGVVTSSSCDLIDAEVLLASARKPSPRPELVPKVLVGDPDDAAIVMLDEQGDLVGTLDPTPGLTNRGATVDLSLCPGGTKVVQQTTNWVVVWDLTTYEVAGRYRKPDGRLRDISCREADASSIWALSSVPDRGDQVSELVPEARVALEFSQGYGSLGWTHIALNDANQSHVIRVDFATGEERVLVTGSTDQGVAVRGTANPSNGTSAVVAVDYGAAEVGTSVLTIFDDSGQITAEYKIDGQASAPVWLDDHRIALTVYVGDGLLTGDVQLTVIDADSGLTTEVEEWSASVAAADGPLVYGTSGGTIRRVDLGDGDPQNFAALPTLALNDDSVVVVNGLKAPGDAIVVAKDPPPTGTTTPPLFRPQASIAVNDNASVQWIARGTWLLVIAAAAAGLVGLATHRGRSGQGDQVQ